MSIQIQTYTTGSFCFNNNGFLCLFYLEERSKDELAICVHENFWKGLARESEADKKTIQSQLVQYLLDQRGFERDPAHPLAGDPEGFKAYCELRYGTLNRFQNRLLAPGLAAAFREQVASGALSEVMASLSGTQRDKFMKVMNEQLGDPDALLEKLDEH